MQSNNSNNSRQLLMREIQIYSFALKDIQLYLDTHPNCMKALAFFKKYKALKKEAVEKYISLYGPLQYEQADDDSEWTWIKSPWPWERSNF